MDIKRLQEIYLGNWRTQEEALAAVAAAVLDQADQACDLERDSGDEKDSRMWNACVTQCQARIRGLK